MVLHKVRKARHTQWLLYNRVVFYFLRKKNKDLYWLLKKYFFKTSNFCLTKYFFYLKWRSVNIDFPNTLIPLYRRRCIFSGKSHGLRFLVSRLLLIKESFHQSCGSFSSIRW